MRCRASARPPRGANHNIKLPHNKARVARLDELTRALRTEVVVIADADDPLLFLERHRYLKALHGAADGLEEARALLAGVVGRLEAEALRRLRP